MVFDMLPHLSVGCQGILNPWLSRFQWRPLQGTDATVELQCIGITTDTAESVMSQGRSYVCLDEHGVYRVVDTRVMLDSVIAAFHQGHSPETIQQQYPTLSLEAVYGSIAFYLANASEVDAYLRRQDAEWKKARALAEANPSPVAERLRALRNLGVTETS
jgi:uncharacterized protein (DUF433 family)